MNQTKFDLGLLLLSLVSQKLVGFISLSFTAPIYREESFHCASVPSAFWTQTNFDKGLLSLSLVSQKLVGGMFPSASCHQHVEKSRLTRPWEPNQVCASFPSAFWTQTFFLRGFTFPQPGFSKTCWGTFPSASRHQHVEKSRFTWPWEPNQVCASFPSAFWTQTNFDLGLLSLSLVSQKLVGYVSLSFTAPTCREESFHLALRT